MPAAGSAHRHIVGGSRLRERGKRLGGKYQNSFGKLILSESISTGVASSGFEGLPIEFRHAEAIARLPPHHNDPFDRLLVVQAMTEGLTLVTHDRRFSLYAIDILWT
jgi:PIN domain nuclease of toxin-antitoxin system